MNLSSILTTELKTHGWSATRLARAAGLSPNVVNTIVTGTTPNPGIRTLLALLAPLGRDLGWLHKQGLRPGAAAVEGAGN